MNVNSWKRFVPVLAILAWLFVVVVSYYTVHKPFGISNLIAVLGVLGDLTLYAALAAIAASIGARLLTRFTFSSSLEALVICSGLGWGLVSFAVFGLGLVGIINRFVFWGLVLIGLILMSKEVRVCLNHLTAIRFPVTSRFERVLAIFVVLTLVLALVRALTPPLAWDAQVYHLAEAKYWLAKGQISAPPDNPTFSYPSLVEMLFLAALVLKGDTLAQVIHWGFLLLSIGLMFSFAQRFLTARIGWIASALILAVPSLVLLASWAYVDIALVFFSTTALYLTISAISSRTDSTGSERQTLILAGAFAGMAMSVKYTAVIIPLAVILVVVSTERTRKTLRRCAYFLIPMAIFASPFLLRNLIFQGNPVYPFIFGGPYWDSYRAGRLAEIGSGLIREPLKLIIAAWDATVIGQEGQIHYEATIGPLLLLLLPALILMRRRSDVLRPLLVFAGALYFFWLFGAAESSQLWQTRLLFAGFPAFAIAAGIGLQGLAEFDLPAFKVSRFARLLVTFVLALTLVGQTLDLVALDPLPVLAGFETRDAYLAKRLSPAGYYSAMQSLAQLGSGAKVLFLWEPRSYYAPSNIDVAPDAMLDRFGDLLARFRNTDEIAHQLRASGYTHLLLSRVGLNFFVSGENQSVSPEDVTALQALLKQQFHLVNGRGTVELTANGSINYADVDAYDLYEINGIGSARK